MNTKEDTAILSESPEPKARQTNIFRVILASSSAFGAAMAMGASGGFPAVTIPQLQNDTSDPLYLSDEQISWFGNVHFQKQLVEGLYANVDFFQPVCHCW